MTPVKARRSLYIMSWRGAHQCRMISTPLSLNTNMSLATDAAGSLAKETTGTVTTVAFPRLATVYLPPVPPGRPTRETTGAGVG